MAPQKATQRVLRSNPSLAVRWVTGTFLRAVRLGTTRMGPDNKKSQNHNIHKGWGLILTCVGDSVVRIIVGAIVGLALGRTDCSLTGVRLGCEDGPSVGRSVGLLVGLRTGNAEGSPLGCEEGKLVGRILGCVDGQLVGVALGRDVDWWDGAVLGPEEGLVVGSVVG
jgi:hypothetical protein